MVTKGGTTVLNKLERRVIDISYKKGLSHLGSCLTSVGLLDKIYLAKTPKDKVVLSNGHAGLALYVVLEKHEGKDAEQLFEKHGVHPNRDVENGIWVSSGSLGQALPIAVGMAIADKTRDIYVLTSDGELAEGSCWEALRIAAELRLENLKIMVNANGYSAYQKVDTDWLDLRLQYFYPSLVMKTDVYALPDYLQGLSGHYYTLTKEDYEKITG